MNIIPCKGAQLTEHALTFENVEYDDWEKIGHEIGRAQKAILWWVGDWCNYGESQFGEKYTQALNVTGYGYGTLRNAAYVARHFPPETRIDGLTFSHHALVAKLPVKDAHEVLNAAKDKDLTVADLRKVMNIGVPKQTIVNLPSVFMCPECEFEHDMMVTVDMVDGGLVCLGLKSTSHR